MDRMKEPELRQVWLRVLSSMRNGQVTQFITGGPRMWTTVCKHGELFTVESTEKGRYFSKENALELLIIKTKAMGELR